MTHFSKRQQAWVKINADELMFTAEHGDDYDYDITYPRHNQFQGQQTMAQWMNPFWQLQWWNAAYH